MIILRNEQFQLSTSENLYVGHEWTVELLKATDIEKRWMTTHHPDGQVRDIARFLKSFGERFPVTKVFDFEGYLVDLASLVITGDFSVGSLRPEVGKRFPGTFDARSRKLSLVAGNGNVYIEKILSVVFKQLMKIKEAA